jgi:hypothetical protein
MRISKTLLSQMKEAAMVEQLSTSEWLQQNAELLLLWLYDQRPLDDNHLSYRVRLTEHIRPTATTDSE